MARTDNLTNFLTDVASAIRTKGGTSSQIPTSDFDTAIANLPGADIDWTALGYSNTPDVIIDGYNYAKNIYDNWDPNTTSMWYKYSGNRNLLLFPLVDTSKVTNMANAFQDCCHLVYLPLIDTGKVDNMNMAFYECRALTSIPDLDTKNVTNMTYTFQNCMSLKSIGNIDTRKVTEFYYTFMSCNSLKDFPVLDMRSAQTLDGMFYDCQNLTDQSLDNVLQSLVSATSYQGTKTLIALNLWGYDDSRIQACPHYQDFVNAGWSIR